MQQTIRVRKLNEVYVKLECSGEVSNELFRYFTFKAPNYQFNPKYKLGYWNGDINLFSKFDKKLYRGLLQELEYFCIDRKYNLQILDGLDLKTNLSLVETEDFVKTLNLPFPPYDYQIEALVHSVRNRRALFLSATSSGKSLTIYLLLRFFQKKTLILVDKINLLNQMFSDFKDYGFDSESFVHRIGDGRSKETDKNIIIGTWQTISNMPKEWLEQFELLIADEVHNYAAKEAKAILEATTNATHRFGFTGTLNGAKLNETTLTGLFGPIEKLIGAKELMDRGLGSELKLKCINLKYSVNDVEDFYQNYCEVKNGKKSRYPSYKKEIEYLYSSEKRNRYIINLALSLKGNTIIMFHMKKHGKYLLEEIQKRTSIPIYFVDGDVDGDIREDIRQAIGKNENSITLASSKVFSTGINIPKIHNIIMTNPTKAQVTVLQTIGRGMRKAEDKFHFNVYDISDDLSVNSRKNFTLQHYIERLKIYINEKFSYKQYKVELK